MVPSRLLALPFAVFTALMLYWAFRYSDRYAPYAIPSGIILAIILTFGYQINWWWYRRFPPDLPEEARRFLERFSLQYRNMLPRAQQEFRQKTALFLMTLEFKAQGFESSMPEEFKLIVASSAVTLTQRQENYLLPDFPVVVIYPGPFPSPQYPELFHASEIFEEDGVLIFSAAHLMKGFTEPERHYDVALHEWARVFVLAYRDKPWPVLEEDTWEQLARISGFTREALLRYVNRPDLELLPAAIVHFVHFPDRFAQLEPGVFRRLQEIFQIAGHP